MTAFMDVRLWMKLTTVLTAQPEISVQAENKFAVLVQHAVFVLSYQNQADNEYIMVVLIGHKPS